MKVADRESKVAKESEIYKKVTPDSPMKVWLVDYVGEKFQQEMIRFKADTGKDYEWDGNITVEMIVDLMAKEFPEFADLEAGQEMVKAEQDGQK